MKTLRLSSLATFLLPWSSLLLLVAGVAKAETEYSYEYRIRHLPGQIADCHRQANELARKFTQLTEIDATGRCVEVDATGGTVVIAYNSEQAVRIVATDRSNNSVNRFGAFATQAACEANLATVKQEFEQKTGLTALVARCYDDSYFYREYPWVSGVESVGETSVRPYFNNSDYFGSAVGMTPAELNASIEAGLRRVGVDVSYVRARSVAGLNVATTMYYATERAAIDFVFGAKLATNAACQAELARARSFLNADALAASFCAGVPIASNYEVTLVTTDAAAFVIRPSVETFANYEACANAREQLVDFYRNDLDRTILGGLCSRGGDSQTIWRVNMFEAR